MRYRNKFLSLFLLSALWPILTDAAPLDQSWIKDRVLNKLSDVLGRRIEVGGELSVDLSWTPTLRAEQVRVANAEWSEHSYMAELGVLEASIDLGRLIKGQLVFPHLTILEPRLLLEVSTRQQANWQFGSATPDVLPQAREIAEDALDTAVREIRKQGEPEPPAATDADAVPTDLNLPLLKQLRVESGRFRYLNHSNNVDLAATLDRVRGQSDGEKTRLEIHATLAEQAVSVSIDGGPVYLLGRVSPPYPLAINLQTKGFNLDLSGELSRPLELGGGEMMLTVKGSGMPALVNAWTGSDLPELPDYQLQARLSNQGPGRWQLQDLNSQFGNSDLLGDLYFDTTGPRPVARAELRSSVLDIAEVNAIVSGIEFTEENPDTPIIIDVTPLQQINAEFSLTLEKMILPGEITLQQVLMQAQLKDGLLELKPLQLTLEDSTIKGELSFNAASPLTAAAQLNISELDLNQLSGLTGNPLGTLSGSVKLKLLETPTDDNGQVALTDLSKHLRLEDSELNYHAAENFGDLDLNFNAGISAKQNELQFNADGHYLGEAFSLEVHGDSPLLLLDSEQDYQLSVELHMLQSRFEISGEFSQLLNWENRFALDFAVAGPDPSILTPLLNIPLPQLPPYKIRGRLKHNGSIYELDNFSGVVGDSDVAGDLHLQPDTDPLTLYATIYSDKVDLDDLAGLIGSAPSTDPGETASAEQRQEKAREQQSAYLLPRKPLNLNQLSQWFNGAIKFNGKRLQTSKLPFDDLDFTLKVEAQQITLNPLVFSIGDGEVRSSLILETDRQPVQGTIESEVKRVNLKKLLAPFEIADDSLGIIGGQAKLWVSGDSLAQWMASADGGLFLLMTQGHLDVLLTELAGLDVGEALVALMGDTESVPIDCAYIDTQAKDGIFKLATAVVDTSDSLFLGDGFIDFNQELIGVKVLPKPKDISLFSLRSPLHIEGRLKQPEIYPGSSGILLRGVAAVALGVGATPLAALLPLIDPPAGGDSVYCSGLIEAMNKAR